MVWPIALEAITAAASRFGVRYPFDEEAIGYYRKGMDAASHDLAKAYLHGGMGKYYAATLRPGASVPYLLQSVESATKVPESARRTEWLMGCYYDLATSYRQMGQAAISRHYEDLATNLADSYIGTLSPASLQEKWEISYLSLYRRMVHAADRGNAAEFRQAWGLAREAAERAGVDPRRYLGIAANIFSNLGDHEQAMRLFEEMTRLPKSGQYFCFLGNLRLNAKDYQAAIKELERCRNFTLASTATRTEISRRTFHFASHGAPTQEGLWLWVRLGVAYEGARDFNKAIDNYRIAVELNEKIRASYPLMERAAFFNRDVLSDSIHVPYWGLTRSFVRRGAASHAGTADFSAAFGASEALRARQLGDIVNHESAPELSAKRLQEIREALEPEDVILAYTFTDREVIVLSLTRERVQGAVIEYDPATLRNEILGVARALADPRTHHANIKERLSAISGVLLGPVSGALEGKKRIVVIPDGAINALPFDLLTRHAEYRPLIEDYTVRLAPSLRYTNAAARQRQNPHGQGLFAVADPAYAKDMKVAGLSPAELRGVARGSDYLKYFTRLPDTRTEVQAIAGLFAGERVTTLLGTDATESVVKRTDLSGYRFLHFATHGIIGGDIPGLTEPALVLAEESGEDGFLTASEAQEMKLNAELTVLSACNTGRGEIFTGEGVMGMSRAFLVAGSRSVLVSLWPVHSKATELLMVAFYTHMRAGLEAPEALRRAKLDMIRSARQGGEASALRNLEIAPGVRLPAGATTELHPFFWAPFVLFGG